MCAEILSVTPISPTFMVIIVVILVMITLTMLNTRRRLRDRGPDPRRYAREQIARLREQREVKGDMESLLSELNEAARRMNAQMDTKAVKLETLIQDADQRIARLGRAMPGPAGGSGSATPGDGRSARLDVLVGDRPPKAKSVPPARGDGSDQVRQRVLTLAEQGMSPVEIARNTGAPPGEVELILALHSRGQEAGPPPESQQ